MKGISRRTFIKTAAAASLFPYAHAMGANNDLRIAIVGVGSTTKGGGRGKADAREFRKIPGVRIVALCDPDHANLDPEVAQFKKWNENVEAYTDIRKLLENKDIDAISITAPNHWHSLAAIWGCQAGKDVFLQKPASHNIFEGRKMIEAAQKYGRMLLVTNKSRSPNGIREAIAYAREGNLGKITLIYGVSYAARGSIGKVARPQPIPSSIDYDLWSGPAPVEPLLRECLHYDWHWFWDYGNGDIGNQGIHNIDGCRQAVGGDRLPPHVISVGGRFGYVDDGQTPNSQLVFLDYRPVPMIYEVRGLPKDKTFLQSEWFKNAQVTMDTYCGTRSGVIVHCENGYIVDNQAFDKKGKPIKIFRSTFPNEYQSFANAVRSRRAGDLTGDALQGHLSAALFHMGNISYRLGAGQPNGVIKERIGGHKSLLEAYDRFQTHLAANGIDFDKTPVKLGPMLTMDSGTERFTGEFSEEANKLVTRKYREPFVVPEKV